jgi:GTP cyclohydrolase II
MDALLKLPVWKQNQYDAICNLPTQWGQFVLHGYTDPQTGVEHAALTMGTFTDGAPVLTRIHSECLTGDSLFSLRCDCGSQLERGMQLIAKEQRGILVYLRQEGRGIGLINKIRAYALQEDGADTVEANHQLGFPDDLRNYNMAKTILDDLGVSNIHLLTNNPAKVSELHRLGVKISKRIPLHVDHNVHNVKYLETKYQRMGHKRAGDET